MPDDNPAPATATAHHHHHHQMHTSYSMDELQLPPPPSIPAMTAVAAGGGHVPSLSARTSFTRVDGDDERDEGQAQGDERRWDDTSHDDDDDEEGGGNGIIISNPSRVLDLSGSDDAPAPAPNTNTHISTLPSHPHPQPHLSSQPQPSQASMEASSQSEKTSESESPNPIPIITSPTPVVIAVPQTPQTYLTFLHISGRRRTMSFDPEMTVGRVKELVWNSWPADWQDERPPAPLYLRILYLGKMLQDDDTLTHLKLPSFTASAPLTDSAPSPAPVPTIVHLSIRPFVPQVDDSAIKKKIMRMSIRRGDTLNTVNTHSNHNNSNNNSNANSNSNSNSNNNGNSNNTHRVNEGETSGGCCGCVVC